MAGLGDVCSDIGALLFYLQSAFRVSKSGAQIGCVLKEPRVVESIPYAEIAVIPFKKPKSQIAGCKRDVHLYSDAIPLADLQLVEGIEEVLEVMLTEDIASNEYHYLHLHYQLHLLMRFHQQHLCYCSIVTETVCELANIIRLNIIVLSTQLHN